MAESFTVWDRNDPSQHQTKRLTMQFARNTDGTYDLAAIGAELEHGATPEECLAFAKEYGHEVNSDIRALATFALFTGQAKNARLKGCLQVATMCERNAQTIYDREIKPANRW